MMIVTTYISPNTAPLSAHPNDMNDANNLATLNKSTAMLHTGNAMTVKPDSSDLQRYFWIKSAFNLSIVQQPEIEAICDRLTCGIDTIAGVVTTIGTHHRNFARSLSSVWQRIGQLLIFLSLSLLGVNIHAEIKLSEQQQSLQQTTTRQTSTLVISDKQDWQNQIEQQLLEQWRDLSGLAPNSHRLTWPASAFQQSHHCQRPVQWQSHQSLQPGRIQLQVRCDAPFWQLNTRLILEQERLVAVAHRDLRSGERFNFTDVNFVSMNIADLPRGYIPEDCPCESLQVRRLIKRGSVLHPSMLEPATVVERGQTIMIRSRQPGMVVEMAGTALSDGHIQQKIRVKNNRSERIIWATIISSERVEVH